MKKPYLVFLSVICGLQVLSLPQPAHAYLYRYHPGAAAVETDLSQLNGEPQDRTYAPDQDDQSDLATNGSNGGSDMPAVKPEEVQLVAPAEQTGKKLSHPFFTATSIAPVEAAAPAAAPVKSARKPLPPVPVAAATVPAQPPVETPVAALKPAPRPAPAPVPAKETPAAIDWNTEPETAEAAPAEMAAAVPHPAIEATVPVPPAPKNIDMPVAPATDMPVAPATTGDNMTQAVADAARTAAPALAAPEMAPAEMAAAAPAPVPAPAPPAAETQEAVQTVPSMADLTIEFGDTSSEISKTGLGKLDSLAAQMAASADMRIQIRAFAKGDASGGSSARRMSLSRALTVRSYLTDKGIKPVRLDVRALGTETDRMPIDRVDLVFVR